MFYNEPVFGCSSQVMHGHVLAFSFVILKVSPNQCTQIHSADPMYTLLLLLICYCIEPPISKIISLRSHVNMNWGFNGEPQFLRSPGNSSKSSSYAWCKPAANICSQRRSYIRSLTRDCKTCFAQGLPREERGERKERATTKISQKAQKEERPLRSSFGEYKIWLPNKRSL